MSCLSLHLLFLEMSFGLPRNILIDVGNVLWFRARQAVYYERGTEARSRNRCYRGITRDITYYDCVFATLVSQHAKCTRRIMWASVA